MKKIVLMLIFVSKIHCKHQQVSHDNLEEFNKTLQLKFDAKISQVSRNYQDGIKKLEKNFYSQIDALKNEIKNYDSSSKNFTLDEIIDKIENHRNFLIVLASLFLFMFVSFIAFAIFIIKKFNSITEVEQENQVNDNIYENCPGPPKPSSLPRLSRFVASNENIYDDPQYLSRLSRAVPENLYDDVVYMQTSRGEEIVKIKGFHYLRLNEEGSIRQSEAIRREAEGYDVLDHFKN